jgi:phage terminase Nu1 subunit (DNA packaging protein)
MAKLVDADRLGRVLNLSRGRVFQLVSLGMPKEGRGRYDPGKCAMWYIRYLQTELEKRGKRVGDSEELTNTLPAEKLRLTKAQADDAELEVGRKRGELIPLELFRSEIEQIYMTLRQRLYSLPRIAPQLEGETRGAIKAKLETSILDLLKSLASGNGKNGHSHGTERASAEPETDSRAGESASGPAAIPDR